MKPASKFPRAKPYRRTPAEVKAIVRFRDGYRCVECGMTAKEHFKKYKKALDVHRLVPGSHYTIKGAVTMCRKCHGKQPKSEVGAVRCGRPGYSNLSIYIDARLHAALMAYVAIAKPRVKVGAVVEHALEKFLQSQGYIGPAA